MSESATLSALNSDRRRSDADTKASDSLPSDLPALLAELRRRLAEEAGIGSSLERGRDGLWRHTRPTYHALTVLHFKHPEAVRRLLSRLSGETDESRDQHARAFTRTVLQQSDFFASAAFPKVPRRRSRAERFRDGFPELGVVGERDFDPVTGRALIDGIAFRSDWEIRTAAILSRLGVGWEYEPVRFQYADSKGFSHTYAPDFRLSQFRDTYVEVKGPAGPTSVDTYKMRLVLGQHRQLTLLLWDAPIIEMLEDAGDPMLIVTLLTRSKLTT